ncbi:hypothetical protein X777_06773 [Ooceraea biroi]|uniref:Uncharacterized protein n=1 Tax=Ooceraea biroi TaxID=2015173 RepID=A0A026WDE2_OOCBI|nr:hypothetical protein X777_06773 [Ooceraea biroi]
MRVTDTDTAEKCGTLNESFLNSIISLVYACIDYRNKREVRYEVVARERRGRVAVSEEERGERRIFGGFAVARRTRTLTQHKGRVLRIAARIVDPARGHTGPYIEGSRGSSRRRAYLPFSANDLRVCVCESGTLAALSRLCNLSRLRAHDAAWGIHNTDTRVSTLRDS